MMQSSHAKRKALSDVKKITKVHLANTQNLSQVQYMLPTVSSPVKTECTHEVLEQVNLQNVQCWPCTSMT